MLGGINPRDGGVNEHRGSAGKERGTLPRWPEMACLQSQGPAEGVGLGRVGTGGHAGGGGALGKVPW